MVCGPGVGPQQMCFESCATLRVARSHLHGGCDLTYLFPAAAKSFMMRSNFCTIYSMQARQCKHFHLHFKRPALLHKACESTSVLRRWTTPWGCHCSDITHHRLAFRRPSRLSVTGLPIRCRPSRCRSTGLYRNSVCRTLSREPQKRSANRNQPHTYR